MRAVTFDRFGGPEILHVRRVPVPRPAAGEVLVAVGAAGLNPVDWKIFSGEPTSDPYERHLPSGNGYDFAGTVVEVGSGVDGLEVGEAVMGGRRFHAQAEYVTIPAGGLARQPAGLDMQVAGGLNVVARTAEASVVSQDVGRDDVVLVSAAAGGVGLVAAQLCIARGATVIGTASPAHHDYLATRGIIPVTYGDGLAARVRAVAPRPVDVVLDNHGRETVSAGLELGVPPARINSIVDHDARQVLGIAGVGGASAGVDAIARVGHLVVDGTVDLPIDSVYELERAPDAYRRLIGGHLRGKVVLVP